MIRTGIFGGSFNPIHNGHIGLAQYILNQKLVDEIWLMVSPHNPLKDDSQLLDEQLRFRMVQCALTSIKGAMASDFEFSLPRPSYTWNTLQALEHEFPEREFTLVIGADNWKLFHKWAHYKDILQRYHIIIYPRPGFPIDKGLLPHNVTLLQMPLFPYSSTEIRQKIVNKESISDLLPSDVMNIFLDAIKATKTE